MMEALSVVYEKPSELRGLFKYEYLGPTAFSLYNAGTKRRIPM
jgi:hypothetical protein